jgi:integrase/recombinase XerD
MITRDNWRTRMESDMRLGDLRPRTIEGYLLATRLFIERVDKEPEKLTEEDVRGYFLHLRDDKHQAPSSINIAICALRFFFNHTLERDFEVFNLLRVHRTRVLPVVLSRAEVLRLLGVVRHPVRRMLLTTIYALGLRIGEGLHLEISNIDSGRNMVWIRDGKGGRDRRVPLPKPLLLKLRHYWKCDRPQSVSPLLFVSAEGGPIHDTTVQKTFKAAQEEAELPRRATVHTLRHYVPF